MNIHLFRRYGVLQIMHCIYMCEYNGFDVYLNVFNDRISNIIFSNKIIDKKDLCITLDDVDYNIHVNEIICIINVVNKGENTDNLINRLTNNTNIAKHLLYTKDTSKIDDKIYTVVNNCIDKIDEFIKVPITTEEGVIIKLLKEKYNI